MRAKRYIYLEPSEVITLQEGYQNVPHHQFRMRCHCLLLSHQQRDMASLRAIFGVTHATISNWLTTWETKGIAGLRNQVGQGRKTILKPTDLALVKAKVQHNPQHLKAVRDELQAELKREFSDKTLRRFLKSLVEPVGEAAVPRRDESA